uniref:cGMP-dependent protein kinase n=1 Tax=Paramormyrops kingsleyae TaxID=1676925 RepID=A0A3B3SH53_9TELE
MGNGSMKTPRPEGSYLSSGLKAPRLWETVEPLRARIVHLEEELSNRERELRARDEQLWALQAELEARLAQVHKLQDALGNQALGSSPSTQPHSSHRLLSVHRRLRAKEGVSAEPTSGHYCAEAQGQPCSLERVRKNSSTKKLINSALMNNDFLKRLEPQHMREVVECMYEQTYTQGQLVIKEGEPGNYLYVLAEGLLEVNQNEKLLGQMGPGTAFGELAILYNCKRTATVKAVSQARIWALDRQMFQNIMMATTQARNEKYFSFLRSVSLLKELPEEKLAKIVDCFEVDYFNKGDYIIREGEEGDTFFIIAKGEVSVTQTVEGCFEPQEIKTLGVGDYFGEKALVSEDVRSANIISKENGTQCLVVDRACPLPSLAACFMLRLCLQVKLKEEDTTFALKCIKKKHIVDTRQQEHIYSEKSILQQADSPFIVRLFRTFRDTKYVYMLLEVCLGGELWSILRDVGFFEESTARFCIGCVLEAFDYLHGQGIVYRDLKPENLLLDHEGYVKMTDFGFAKKIGPGKKTWTFCGTPEYVAPEVILNKGHDFGADCWSLGILIFELLTGSPPFTGSDPIKIYTMVLHGIEKVDFPKRISKRPSDLIRSLCRLHPAERLGNKKNGILDIKKQKWFQGFNWEGLRTHRLPSPLERELSGPLDHSRFDIFPPDLEEPAEELSGWDKEF